MKKRYQAKDQHGFASFIMVFLLIILLTLISLGFARIMNRATVDSTNRQLGDAANYVAESGINDVVSYMRQFAQDPANAAKPYVSSPNCNTLIGNASDQGPFYNDANVSNNSSHNDQYSCLLLNQTPSDLIYQNISELTSQVVDVNSSAAAGALNSVMVSWQPSGNPQNSPNYPPSPPQLLDDTTWNDNNHDYMPMLRVTIYPVPNSGSVANLQANSKTVFLYPQAASAGTYVLEEDYKNTLNNGQLLSVPCSTTSYAPPIAPGSFTGDSDYRCNLIITNLINSVSSPVGDPIDSFYIRVTPIYGASDVKLQINDSSNNKLEFIGDQAVVDVTATVSNVSKRLQARVDISNELTSSSNGGNDIEAGSDLIPEDSIRTPDAICKRIYLHHDLYNYISFDTDVDTVCGLTGTTLPIPAPQLNFTITGHSAPDNGITVAAGQKNQNENPSPAEPGTVFISAGGNVTLNWTAQDVTSCNASSSDQNGNDTSGTTGFTGDVLVPPYNTTTSISSDGDHEVSVGSWVSPGNNVDYENFNLDCNGPGGTLPRQTVTAWPPPIVNISGPSTVNAGDNYTIGWSTNNVKPSGCVLSGGSWSDPSDTNINDSETMNWPWYDNSSVRTFTVTCYDPIGRSASATWTVSVTSGPPGGTQVLPPDCSASINPVDYGNGTGTFTWTGSCPEVSPNSGYYQLYNCSNIDCADIGTNPGWVGTGGTGPTLGVGSYCADLRAGVDPWGWLADSGQVCWQITYPQVVITQFEVLAWDNGPVQCGNVTTANDTWDCRNGTPYYFDKGDGGTRASRITDFLGLDYCEYGGNHRYSLCYGGIFFNSQFASGSLPLSDISCQMSSDTYGNFDGAYPGGYQVAGPDGWVDAGSPYPFELNCTGPSPGPGGGPNTANARWNG